MDFVMKQALGGKYVTTASMHLYSKHFSWEIFTKDPGNLVQTQLNVPCHINDVVFIE